MAYELLVPQRGKRPENAGRVTVARARDPKRRSPQARVNVSTAICAQLGWAGGKSADGTRMRLSAALDRAAGKLRLARDEGKDSWGVSWKNGTGTVMVTIPGVEGGNLPVEVTPHAIEDGALVVDLPAWALAEPPATPAPPPRPAPPPPVARAVKAPPHQRPASSVAQAKGYMEILNDLTHGEPDPDGAGVEAIDMLRQGKSGRHLADHFGWELGPCANLAIAYRSDTEARRAA